MININLIKKSRITKACKYITLCFLLILKSDLSSIIVFEIFRNIIQNISQNLSTIFWK